MPREELVLETGETEVRVVLNRVEAFCAPVNRSLRQTDQEWHQDEGKETEKKHGDHGEQIANQARLVLDDRVGDGVAVGALHFQRPRQIADSCVSTRYDHSWSG